MTCQRSTRPLARAARATGRRAQPALRHLAPALLALLLAVITNMPASAQERGVVFAGATAGKAPSAGIGAVVALPGDRLGQGVAVRAVLGRDDYRYVGAVTTVKGRETVVTVSAVYQWSGGWGYANVAAGATHRVTRLTPDDPGNPSRGTKWDGVVGVDGERDFGRWQVGGLASYGFDLREYYARLAATRTLAGSLRAGAEFVAQGNPNYDRQLYGATTSVRPARRMEFRISAGALVQDHKTSAYASLSLSRVF